MQCVLKIIIIEGYSVTEDVSPKSSRAVKLLLFVVCVFGMLNFYVYNAGLISFLMSQEYKTPINELHDFLTRPHYKLLIIEGTSMETYLSQSYDETHLRLWSNIKKHGSKVSTHEEVL